LKYKTTPFIKNHIGDEEKYGGGLQVLIKPFIIVEGENVSQR
jgi:hypothetical protein